MRQRFAERAFAKADAIFDAWEDTALGHYREVTNPLTGTVRVYFKPPNPLAIKDMMEQVWGKPKQPIELSIEEVPEYDYEALNRMGKYVEPNDPHFIDVTAKLVDRSTAIDIGAYQVRRVGERLTNDPEGTQSGLDQDDPTVET